MKRGFTLIEILIVISIIMILSGIVVYGTGRIKERVKRDATKSLIIRITAALNEYHLAYFVYPPSSGEHQGSRNLYYFLGLPLDLKQGYDPAKNEMQTRKFGPATSFKSSELSPEKDIIDLWGNSFYYQNPGIDHSSSGGKDSRSFVDIESAGPNGQFQNDDATNNDDINNWTYEKYPTK